jgi:mxaA protein
MRIGFPALLCSALMWMTVSANAVQATTAVVEQPRPFGHVLGDVITQRVLLEAANTDFTPAELPSAQRINVWFERRTPTIERTSDGRRWLRVDYQIINTPQVLETTSLPAWKLKSSAGIEIEIPAWPISIAALTPVPIAPRLTGELRPDRAAPTVDTAPIRRQLILWTAASLLALAAWFGWLQRRNYRDRSNKPFARAWHEIQRLDESSPEAWQALHRAFDRAAGRVVQTETVPVLLAQAPYLVELRARIEQFFQQSSERFFSETALQHQMSVRALCRELRQLERRSTS